ncbi:hypothetical protein ABZ806_04155 [Spirillospora sp. NPDC047418]
MLDKLVGRNAGRFVFAAVGDFEDQLVALVAVLAGQFSSRSNAGV